MSLYHPPAFGRLGCYPLCPYGHNILIYTATDSLITQTYLLNQFTHLQYNTYMKKMFICIAMLAIACVAMGQAKPTKVAESKTTQVVKVDDKTFKAANSKKSGGDYKPTGYYYQLKSGEKREIYIHTKTRGEHKGQQACYIQNPKGGWREISVKPENLK